MGVWSSVCWKAVPHSAETPYLKVGRIQIESALRNGTGHGILPKG
jgi:hypothetical protein